jgi:hypothetical protein
MPNTVFDPNTPRYQLRFEDLPRGFVSFPPHLVEGVAKERAKFPPEVFTEEYARHSLELHTLIHYYEGLLVAYRSLPDGIEVLGVGWEETKAYLRSRPEDVKLVQP